MRREFFLSFLVRVFLQSLRYEVEVPLRLANRQIFRINLKNPPAARALARNPNGTKKMRGRFFYSHGGIFKLLQNFFRNIG